MADNITLPGEGSIVATDDVGGVHYPLVKLDVGGNGLANPLRDVVTPLALLPTSTLLVRIVVTPTVSLSAYSLKDAVGGILTLTAARQSDGSLVLEALTVVDKSQQMPQLDLVLFGQAFTPSSDNAAFDPSDADLANVVGVISIVTADWHDFNDNSVATKTNINLPIRLTGTSSLNGQLVARSTPTFVGTSDISVVFLMRQN